MKSRFILLILVYLLFPFLVKSQIIKQKAASIDSVRRAALYSGSTDTYNRYFSSIAPSSPTVDELMKYAEIPVDYSKGLANIEIPLYTLECGDISLPITLSYHSGGIKVDQIASWVGLGWSLNAGGVVKRVCLDNINGGPRVDDCCYGLKKKEDMRKYINNGVIDRYMYQNIENMYEEKQIPDIFSYNFAGHSGRFFAYNYKAYDLDGSQEILFSDLYPNSASGGHYINALDLKGFKYEFNKRVSTTTYIEPLFLSNISRVWEHIQKMDSRYDISSEAFWLTKISSPSKKDSLTFTYTVESVKYKNMTGGVMSRREATMWGDLLDNSNTSMPGFSNNETFSTNARLSEIVMSNGGRVVFVVGADREDVLAETISERSKVLSEIKIYGPLGDLLKRWIFNYGYFEAYAQHPVDPSSNLRLKLKSIKELGADSSNPQEYIFTYYGDDPGEYKMPFRTSFSGHDYWGYCNANPAVNELKNYRRAFPQIDRNSRITFSDGSNMEPNRDYQSAYSLKEIKYPAGGRRKFEYEPNEIMGDNSEGQRIRRILNYYSDIDSTEQVFTYWGGYSTESFRMFRIRKKDLRGYGSIHQSLTEPWLGDYYDVSSSPFTTFASSTSKGLLYSAVSESRDDSEIDYKYYAGNGNDNIMPEYSYYRVMIAHSFYDDFSPNSCIYNEYMDESNHLFQFNNICKDYKHGHLIKKQISTNDGFLVRESYEYDFQERDTIPIMEMYYGPKEWTLDYIFYDFIVSEYVTGKALLKYKTINSFRADRLRPQIQKQTEEIYDYNNYDLLSKITTATSNEEVFQKEIRYASDINQYTYNEMEKNRMINYPIEVVQKNDGKVIEGSLTLYKELNNMFLPDKMYELKPSLPLNSYTFYNGSVNSYYGESIGMISEFTPYGKVAAMRGKDMVNVVYLWGYNNMYPIAEIRNATYSEVTTLISKSNLNFIASRLQPTVDDWVQINNLRTSLPYAQITVFTYKPLIGVTSICGPDENITYYKYDSFSRLQEIYRMNNGTKELIEVYEYNYRQN